MAELVVGNVGVFIVAAAVVVVVVGEVLLGIRLLAEFEVKLFELGLRLGEVICRAARFSRCQRLAALRLARAAQSLVLGDKPSFVHVTVVVVNIFYETRNVKTELKI